MTCLDGMIHAPEKYKDYYMSRVTRKNNKNFIVKVPDCKVAGIHALANDNGYVIKMYIPTDSIAAETMADIDAMAIKAASDNNREWFANGLSNDKINEYFRTCSVDGFADVLVSAIKVPRNIEWRGDLVEDFSQVALTLGRELKAMDCSCTLEAQGLYFYPKKFGIRWIVRDIAFRDRALQTTDDDVEAIGPETTEAREIEAFWEKELQDVRDMIKKDMEALYARIDKLATFKRELMDMLETAKTEKTCSSSWDSQLDNLRCHIFRYKTGRL